MDVKYAGGQRVHVDDPEFDPVWDKCAELGIPVLIHIAEPSAFFDPWDYHNERWLELKQFPGRARPPDKYPPFETLIAERNRLFAKHPKTNFIAAHLAFHGNDLERLRETLDALPNMYVDIAAVLAELGPINTVEGQGGDSGFLHFFHTDLRPHRSDVRRSATTAGTSKSRLEIHPERRPWPQLLEILMRILLLGELVKRFQQAVHFFHRVIVHKSDAQHAAL